MTSVASVASAASAASVPPVSPVSPVPSVMAVIPVSTLPQRLPRGRVWLRVLVLLLALLVPVAHTALQAPVPSPAVTGEVLEYGVLDTALRPPTARVHHTAVPPHSAPLRTPAPAIAQRRCLRAPTPLPYVLLALRSVVLRC
ncbi:hypothetical protein [Streptomyces sp. NPDC046805]|uniref:hypothetical protein n=1 Tax=Streptomyces sp. NPDC046805 TaxID=3155134 RepID=UPI0033EAF2AA